MKIKPLFDRVVIDANLEENKTKSGIVLPETSQEKPQIGVIVAIGDGESVDNDKTTMKVSVGDKVIFSKYAGTELKLDNKTYKPGDFATFTIKSMSKSRMSGHQIISLTMKDIGTIVPITFKHKEDNSWYGCVEGDENYPIGKIEKLHQNAIYEANDCHIARVADYTDEGKPIYKLI